MTVRKGSLGPRGSEMGLTSRLDSYIMLGFLMMHLSIAYLRVQVPFPGSNPHVGHPNNVQHRSRVQGHLGKCRLSIARGRPSCAHAIVHLAKFMESRPSARLFLADTGRLLVASELLRSPVSDALVSH